MKSAAKLVAYFSVFCTLLCCTTTLGCFGQQSSKPEVRVVTDADKGSKVELAREQVLEIRLASQPGTGYKWYLDPKSTENIKLIEESQTKAKTSGFDRPVLQVFRFRANTEGVGLLRLNYIRPWEKSAAPEKSYELNISVK